MTEAPLWITLAWAAILGVILLGFEAYTLWRDGKGDTLSEHVWKARSWLFGRPALYGLWGWLSWHFVVEEFVGSRAHEIDDWTVVGVSVVLGFGVALAKRRRVKHPR